MYSIFICPSYMKNNEDAYLPAQAPGAHKIFLAPAPAGSWIPAAAVGWLSTLQVLYMFVSWYIWFISCRIGWHILTHLGLWFLVITNFNIIATSSLNSFLLVDIPTIPHQLWLIIVRSQVLLGGAPHQAKCSSCACWNVWCGNAMWGGPEPGSWVISSGSPADVDSNNKAPVVDGLQLVIFSHWTGRDQPP